MSWMEQLYKTYENNIGKHTQDDVVLAPLAHIYKKAQIEVSLDMNGDFYGAYVLDNKENAILIPVTEASLARTSSTKAPHALSDTLSYLAGDFTNYCKTKLKNTVEEKYQIYIKQLKEWNESNYTHYKLNAIYQYLNKKRLLSDLIKTGLITLTDGNVLDNKKISGEIYERAIVRFRVLSQDDTISSTWEDLTLINSYDVGVKT